MVGAQNYKSKQEQMDVVSLNIIPERPAFNIKVFLKKTILLFIFVPLTGIDLRCDTQVDIFLHTLYLED